MKKRTTTSKLGSAITDNLVSIIKAEIYNKTTCQTDVISAGRFKESLDFLCETVFLDCIKWHYEWDCKTNSYIAETGRVNPDAENIVTVVLGVCDGVNDKDVEKMLAIVETEDFTEKV